MRRLIVPGMYSRCRKTWDDSLQPPLPPRPEEFWVFYSDYFTRLEGAERRRIQRNAIRVGYAEWGGNITMDYYLHRGRTNWDLYAYTTFAVDFSSHVLQLASAERGREDARVAACYILLDYWRSGDDLHRGGFAWHHDGLITHDEAVSIMLHAFPDAEELPGRP